LKFEFSVYFSSRLFIDSVKQPKLFDRLLEQLGVVTSFSRTRVSNDNPFSGALFPTFKYVHNWPTQGFASMEEARGWVTGFVRWYNTEHRHSAIHFVTPEQRHRGEDCKLLASRRQIYELARTARPERWSACTRN